MSTSPLFPDDTRGVPLAEAVVRHSERYGVILPASVRRVLYPRPVRSSRSTHDEVARVLDALVSAGRLERLPGDSPLSSNTYYKPGHEPKVADLARLWWCCLDRVRRPLISYSELKPLFAAERLKPPWHNFSHAVECGEGGPTVCRIYQCGAESRKNIREQVRNHLTVKSKHFAHWVDQGSYRLAVLVTTESKQRMVESLIREPYRASPPLAELGGVTVSVVPNEQTFAAMHADYLVRESDV